MDALPGLGPLPDVGEQSSLLRAEPSVREVVGDVADPVAHVHVELHQPHLDRVFDYLVPAEFDASAVVGTRVMVDVAELRVSGFIVARDSESTSGGRLRPLRRVVTGLPVLTRQIYDLGRRVADAFAASVSDVLTLAVPQRHARAEKAHLEREWPDPRLSLPREGPRPGPWAAYRGGAAFVSRVAAGQGPRAVCCALPGPGGGEEIAVAVRAARASGRGALVVVPTVRQARTVAESLRSILNESVATMIADEAHEQRYATFLRVLAGDDRIVVGTRGAMWAPVQDLGLCVVVDDAAPSLREVRSPRCPARDVLALRSRMEGAALLVLSTYVSPESAALVDAGVAALVEGEPAAIRSLAPRVSSADRWSRDGAQWSRIPESAFALVREGLTRGPVLVAVPRAGYIPLVSCADCGELASCETCGGRLEVFAGRTEPSCGRCGKGASSWRCDACGGGRLRSARLGSHRTAEEIGRAFSGTGILLSGAQTSEGVIERVSGKPRIVVSTPGSEPLAEGGYSAALVLDSRFLRGEGPGSQIEFLRRVTRIASLVRASRQGGHLMFAGGIDDDIPALLSSWGMPGYAARLLAERAQLCLPPSLRWLAVTGRDRDVRSYLAILRTGLRRAGHDAPSDEARQLDPLLAGGIWSMAEGFALLGPVGAEREGEIVVYVRSAHRDLGPIGRAAHREYSAKQLGAPLRLEINPQV